MIVSAIVLFFFCPSLSFFFCVFGGEMEFLTWICCVIYKCSDVWIQTG